MNTQRFLIRDDRIRHNAMAAVSNLPGEQDGHCWEVNIKPYKRKRSLEQNALLWMWYGVIQRHLEESVGQIASAWELHEHFVALLCPARTIEIAGEATAVRKSTSQMTVGEMSEYLNRLEMYCADRLDLILPRPLEYRYAMEGKDG